jgi:hypothetical protein
VTSARVHRRLTLLAVGLGAILLTTAWAAAAGIRIVPSTETWAGLQSPTEELNDWKETGAVLSVTPTPKPAALGTAAGAPTRLAAAAAGYLLDAGTAGDTALAWSFSEAVGLGTNLEIELDFTIHWTRGGTAEASTLTVYVETQATAIGAAVVFTFYFDAGAATGILFASEYALSQSCATVGACP